MYTIRDAHRDDRHRSTHPLDRAYWISVGCEGCKVTLPGNVPDPEAGWVFEGPDPEVGIFGDLVVHTCTEDPEQATEVVDHYAAIDPRIVNERTTYTCPACGATTTCVEQHPADWFAEPGREMFEVVHEGIVTVYA
jgi:hypothetical protein